MFSGNMASKFVAVVSLAVLSKDLFLHRCTCFVGLADFSCEILWLNCVGA